MTPSFAVEEADDVSEPTGNSYTVGDAIPGVPSGALTLPVSGWAAELEGVRFAGSGSTRYVIFHNGGTEASAATTLRFYRSRDRTISTGDSLVGQQLRKRVLTDV